MQKVLFVLLAAVLSVGGLAFADDGVNNGTVLQGTLSSDVSTATAQIGDPIIITGAHDDSGAISGSLYGHVTQVQKAAPGVHAQLNFVIDRLSTAGTNYTVDAVSEGITPPGASAGKEATAALAGALAGAFLGKALGHSTNAMLAGVIAGAGAGFLLTSRNYQNIDLQQGSTVKVLLKRVARMQARQQ